MKRAHVLVSVAVALAAAGAVAAINTTVWVPSGPANDAQELANKKLALEWWREFWDKGKDKDWARWMKADFINHDPREPAVGAQALVDWLHQSRPAAAGMNAGMQANTQQRGVRPQMFAIAEGNLVFIAHAPPGFDVNNVKSDPGLHVSGNFVRVENGKIAEWWFTGGGDQPQASADAAQPGADKIDVTKNSTRPANYDGTTLIYDSGKGNSATEAANKKLVFEWLDDFWSNQNQDNWAKYMAADFRNHDSREPAVGAQALVDWLKARVAEHPDRRPKKGASNPHLFVMADGDLVLLAGSPQMKQFDAKVPVQTINGNIIRIKDGKIAEWWFIGPEAAAAAPATNGMGAGT